MLDPMQTIPWPAKPKLCVVVLLGVGSALLSTACGIGRVVRWARRLR